MDFPEAVALLIEKDPDWRHAQLVGRAFSLSDERGRQAFIEWVSLVAAGAERMQQEEAWMEQR